MPFPETSFNRHSGVVFLPGFHIDFKPGLLVAHPADVFTWFQRHAEVTAVVHPRQLFIVAIDTWLKSRTGELFDPVEIDRRLLTVRLGLLRITRLYVCRGLRILGKSKCGSRNCKCRN